MKLIEERSRTDRFFGTDYDTQHSQKYLFQLHDGATIETTKYSHWKRDKLTAVALDISTMVGCPVQCTFCAAGTLKFTRKLTVNEVLEQARIALREEFNSDVPMIICSFQGIGEPSLVAALVSEASEGLLGIDSRVFISIATVAQDLSAFDHWAHSNFHLHNLMVSITQSLVPVTGHGAKITHPLETIVEATHRFVQKRKPDKAKFNLILMKDRNDSDAVLKRLSEVIGPTNLPIRVSSLNSTHASRRFGLVSASSLEAEVFVNKLRALGVSSYVFGAFNDIEMSCGQLTFSAEMAK